MIQLPVTLTWDKNYQEARCSNGDVYTVDFDALRALAWRVVLNSGDYLESFNYIVDAIRFVEHRVMAQQVSLAPKYRKGTTVTGVVTEDSNGPEVTISVDSIIKLQKISDNPRYSCTVTDCGRVG